MEYRPFFRPLLRKCVDKGQCADLLAVVVAANLLILVLFASLIAVVAAGDVASSRLFLYLMIWGGEIVVLSVGALWIVCNLITHVAQAGHRAGQQVRQAFASRQQPVSYRLRHS
jgi:hypothetical protein